MVSSEQLSSILNSYVIKECFINMPPKLPENDQNLIIGTFGNSQPHTPNPNLGANPNPTTTNSSSVEPVSGLEVENQTGENSDLSASENQRNHNNNKNLLTLEKIDKDLQIKNSFGIEDFSLYLSHLSNTLPTEVKDALADRLSYNKNSMIYITLSETRLSIFDNLADNYKHHTDKIKTNSRLKESALIQIALLNKPKSIEQENAKMPLPENLHVTSPNSPLHQNSLVNSPINPNGLQENGNHGPQFPGNPDLENQQMAINHDNILKKNKEYAVQYLEIIGHVLKLNMKSMEGYDSWISAIADTLRHSRYTKVGGKYSKNKGLDRETPLPNYS